VLLAIGCLLVFAGVGRDEPTFLRNLRPLSTPTANQ
jgi:hypothetical protein